MDDRGHASQDSSLGAKPRNFYAIPAGTRVGAQPRLGSAGSSGRNIGVRPDVVVDYMTRTNLMTAGAPFVQAFTQAIVKHAQTAP